MFQNDTLKEHLETSSVVKAQSEVVAEWNMNIAENISYIGNYRYRPLERITLSPSEQSVYSALPNNFSEYDEGNFYTGATDADVVIDGGYDDEDVPITFTSNKNKEKLLFSLESCFSRFRPRSGISKLRYFSDKYTFHSNSEQDRRPRYYMAHKDDAFKYWTSYRTESGVERGIANQPYQSDFYIDDAAPFVVYKERVPANRIVVKMQTNVGDIDLGPFSNLSSTFDDPFYGYQNQTTPVQWKIQYLYNDNWIDAISFTQNSVRSDGTPIIGPDGYVEVEYGLIVPEQYSSIFIKAGEFGSSSLLPTSTFTGSSYLVRSSATDIGIYYIWTGSQYEQFTPTYGWKLSDESYYQNKSLVTELSNPIQYIDPSTGETKNTEFQYLSGLRIAVETMNVQESTFDLIELSPRLTSDLSEKVTQFQVSKNASDLGVSGMPVGQLLASTGALNIFDYDQSFTSLNSNSIISPFIGRSFQVKLYEKIYKDNAFFSVPIKTMYSDGFPSIGTNDRSVSIQLRDLFFYFESQTAPQLLIPNCSLSYATSLLLDSIGFSNYKFFRAPGESEQIIPFFYVGPDKSVAQVLQDLAISTQTSMFFDEYNNFVMMSKDYMMPLETTRDTDMTLRGTKDFQKSSVYRNQATDSKLANIQDISYQDNQVYNDGRINYTARYLQKSIGSIKQASLLDQDRFWIYRPALLWEVAGTEITKSQNDQSGTQSTYVLSAIPLNSDLTSSVPEVVNREVVNNVIDFGEGVYWLARYSGYFYANGEVIRYDATEFNVSGTGNVWISSSQEYQRYFANIPFNGKMYPTGLVRIYSEPNYEDIDGVTYLSNGEVAKHGRGQFGTDTVNHVAGIDPYWYDNDNIRGCTMESQHLFLDEQVPVTEIGPAGIDNELAKKTTRNGIIRNFLSSSYINETTINSLYSTQKGSVQSSALILNGPKFATTDSPVDFISYIHKPLDNKFKHFGTRMRIIGKIENNENRGQTPVGSTSYYEIAGATPEKNINIGGASGGLAVMVNPETNNGYYFEIIALTDVGIDAFDSETIPFNIVFYKVVKDSESENAIPVKLWSGISSIISDSGSFVGQERIVGESNPTVYDLAVEYEDIGSSRRFYLYINNNLISSVDDESPLPIYNNMGIFVRGSARCMFENIYAVANNYSQNTAFAINTPISSVFGDDEVTVNESFRKYSMSGMVKQTYLSGISPSEPPKYNLYFEEFGTIMREASYFNVRYDKAYPALSAKLSPTYNGLKGYTVSGFIAGAYGAEFMIFNATDTALSLDATSGNYLRIQGVTFTQQSRHELTVDEYFNKKSDFSDVAFSSSSTISSPSVSKQQYQDIKFSRLTYGKKDFSLEAPYIQTQDDADSLMGWMISKIMKPRKSVGIRLFGTPILQLGDIVKIDYTNNEGISETGDPDTRFVVYSIDYERSNQGPSMTAYVSEVL